MSPLWKGRPRHSQRRTYLPSSVRFVRLKFLLLPPLFAFPSRVTLARDPRAPSQRFVDPQPSPHGASHPRRRFRRKDTSSLSRLRFHVAESGALYRDKSRTLTVWAFLAAEGGANKVKRELKNVTLSVECGLLTVGAPPSRGRTLPPLPRHSSRGTYLAMGSTSSRSYGTLTPIDNRFNLMLRRYLCIFHFRCISGGI